MEKRFPAVPVMALAGVTLLSVLVWNLGGEPLRNAVQSRAAVEMEDDFNTGLLDGWFGGRDWAHNWVHDGSGAIRVGQLALYRPSVRLVDYNLEFSAVIDRAGVGWVYRASDLRNYYAMKLLVVKPGPPLQFAIERYAVTGGQPSPGVRVPVRMRLQEGVPYRIRTEARGSTFRTLIENEVVDVWSDDRLPGGGIGFFTDSQDDERARLYWMRVSLHNDLVGRLCALIAPSS